MVDAGRSNTCIRWSESPVAGSWIRTQQRRSASVSTRRRSQKPLTELVMEVISTATAQGRVPANAEKLTRAVNRINGRKFRECSVLGACNELTRSGALLKAFRVNPSGHGVMCIYRQNPRRSFTRSNPVFSTEALALVASPTPPAPRAPTLVRPAVSIAEEALDTISGLPRGVCASLWINGAQARVVRGAKPFRGYTPEWVMVGVYQRGISLSAIIADIVEARR